MEEQDVGRVLAAAAPSPEAVPPVGNLTERARTLGRRRRLRRRVVTSGGAGVTVAAVVGAVVALGGFGAGRPGMAGTQAGAGSHGVTSTSPQTTNPATPPSSASSVRPTSAPTTTGPSFPKATDDPAADAKVTAAVKAALPAAYRDGLKLYRAAGIATSYGAEFTWGSKNQEVVLDLSVGSVSPHPVTGTPSMCQTDPRHCTNGTATLQGHQVTWQYYDGDLSAPTFNVLDAQGLVSYGLMASGPTAPQLPGLDVMKDVGLNDQVAAALLAAWPRQ